MSHTDRETDPQRIEVHVNGVCLAADPSIETGDPLFLLCRRADHRELFPGKWEIGCGGQARPGETFEQAVCRHFLEDLSIAVETLPAVSLYSIERPDHPTIPGVRILCRRKGRREPQSPRYRAFLWARPAEIAAIPTADLIPGCWPAAQALFNSWLRDRALGAV